MFQATLVDLHLNTLWPGVRIPSFYGSMCDWWALIRSWRKPFCFITKFSLHLRYWVSRNYKLCLAAMRLIRWNSFELGNPVGHVLATIYIESGSVMSLGNLGYLPLDSTGVHSAPLLIFINFHRKCNINFGQNRNFICGKNSLRILLEFCFWCLLYCPVAWYIMANYGKMLPCHFTFFSLEAARGEQEKNILNDMCYSQEICGDFM